MIKHVVLFRLKAEADPQDKQRAMQAFRQAILALQTQIPTIQRIEVGFNANPNESYDIALYSEFASLAHVEAYATHPAHVAAAQIILPLVEHRACSDYEI